MSEKGRTVIKVLQETTMNRFVFISFLVLRFVACEAQTPPVYSGWTVWGGGPSTLSIEPRSGTDLWLKVTSSHCAHGTHQYFNTVAGTSYRIDFDLDLGTANKVNLLIWDVTPGGTLYNTRVITYTAGGNGLSQTFLAGDTRALIQFRQDTCTGTYSFYLDNIHIAEVPVTSVVMIDSLDAQYRYGFNGQEKLNETYGNGNAYDFGARIYDSRLGKWLSTDPLQQKYPDISPYSYCANSPVMLLELEGKTFRIAIKTVDGKDSYVDFKVVEGQIQLTMEDGTKYEAGKNQFVDDVVNSYKYIEENGADVEHIMQQLASSDKIVNVKLVEQSAHYNNGSNTIQYNPLEALYIPNAEGGTIQSPAVGFWHEAYHAWIDLLMTDETKKKELKEPVSMQDPSTTKAEQYIVDKEKEVSKNLNQKEKKEAVRTKYGQEDDTVNHYTESPTSTAEIPKKSAKEKNKNRNQTKP